MNLGKLAALALFGVIGVATPAAAEGDYICVRNFLGGDPAPTIDVCEQVGGRYQYALPLDETAPQLCVVIYPAAACKMAGREYRQVIGADGEVLCVVDFNQPGVGNYCEAAPELYAYAKVGAD